MRALPTVRKHGKHNLKQMVHIFRRKRPSELELKRKYIDFTFGWNRLVPEDM